MSEETGNSVHPAKRHMDAALRVVSGARREKYGLPEKNFDRIASLWDAYLWAKYEGESVVVDAKDVCHMMDLVKLARLIETPDHEDSIVDRFGYQACYVDLIADDWPTNEWQDWPASAETPAFCAYPECGLYGVGGLTTPCGQCPRYQSSK